MTTTMTTCNDLEWMAADELASLGFAPGGPERDYGQRWGDDHSVRVSYAPHRDPDRTGGYLYAYDKTHDRYALLAADTTSEDVERVWPYLAGVDEPQGYRNLVELLTRPEPMRTDVAKTLLMHCLDRELAAQRALDSTSRALTSPAVASHAMYGRAARMAAQDLLLDAVSAVEPEQFLVIEYRIPYAGNLVGHLATMSPRTAVVDVADVRRLAAHHDYEMAVVNFVHRGMTIDVTADKVPQRIPASIEM